jgi:hypothetical protein
LHSPLRQDPGGGGGGGGGNNASGREQSKSGQDGDMASLTVEMG